LTDTPPAAARRLRPIVAFAAVMLLVLVGIYAARKAIAREVLVGWLHARGIAAEAQVDSLGFSGATASVRIGDPSAPDFSADRVEVGYGLKGFGLEVRTVILTRPVLRARLHDGRLSAGALDPLIAEFRKSPPRPDATKPTIVVRGGRLLLATDYGAIDLAADARIADNVLVSASARSAPTHLRGAAFDVKVAAATATAQTAAGRLAVTLDAPLSTAVVANARLDGGRLRLAAALPYPDFARQRGDGAIVVHVELTGRRMAIAGQSLDDAVLSAALTGHARGWISDLDVTGQGVADLRAGAGGFGSTHAHAIRVAATADDLRWTRAGGDAVSAQLKLTGLVDSDQAAALRLQAVSLTAAGPLRASRQGLDLRLTASVLGRGAWSGLGSPVAADSAEIAAVKRAAQGFRFTAPGVSLTLGKGDPTVALDKPAQLLPDRGGAVSLASAGFGWRLAAAGGGLPRITADIDSAALIPSGAEAQGRIRAGLSIGPIRGGEVDAAGRGRLVNGLLTFTAAKCVAVKAQRLAFGANAVTDLSGQLCPTGAPVLTFGNGAWRIAGAARTVAARAPFLQAKVSDAAGTVSFGAVGERLDAHATITAATMSDMAPSARFRPLGLRGTAALEREIWTSDLAVSADGHHLAGASLRHDGRSGVGRIDFDTGLLTFAAAGLQPAALSPLAGAVGAAATGQAQFAGHLAWTPAGLTSAGVLTVPRLDFKSPAGAVSGLSGAVTFTSLAPLVAAPGQRVHVERIDSLIPISDVEASFGLDGAGLHVSGGQALVGGGSLRIVSLDLPLGAAAPIRGDLELDGVQLHDLVEASPFGDKVDLQAKVSGRLPFTAEGPRVRVTGGSLRAIEPGRLSIDPRALSSVASSGGAAPTATPSPTDTFTGLAYQAMEDLAFETLQASVDSHPDGRLGMLFHIVGRHDPPQKQQIKISLLDLIQKKFLDRQLPLPSGTQVDLTLDTSLNLDDLLADYANYQALRSSGAVQP
jgi:hypothetical protein